METGGGGGEVSEEVVSRAQFSSPRGAGRSQRHPILALPGGCRAERLMWALTRGGDGCTFVLTRIRKWKFRVIGGDHEPKGLPAGPN